MPKWFRVNSSVEESYENTKGEVLYMHEAKGGDDWEVVFIPASGIREALYSGKSENKAKEILHGFIYKEKENE